MSNSIKLSNYIRDQIISNAMNNAFEAEYKAITKKLAAHAMDCYRSVIGEAEEKAARKAPVEFLNMTNAFKIDYRDSDTGRHLCREYDIEVPKAVPFRGNVSAGYLSIKDQTLYLAYKVIEAERDAVNEKKTELRDSIRRTVYSTTSLKKLIEVWPEVESFLPASLVAPKPMLPALPVAELNAALKAAGVKVGAIIAPKTKGGLVAVSA
jgi:Nucleotide modification associated domain 5